MVRIPGRRGAVLAAPAAVVCLGLALSGCGSGGGTGYVAVGAAGPSRSQAQNVPPDGKVALVPLDGGPGASTGPGGTPEESSCGAAGTPGGGAAGTGGDGRTAGPPGTPGSPPRPAIPSLPGTSDTPGTPGAPGSPGTTPPGTPAPGTTPPTAPPNGPAHLTVSAPRRTPAADRWCEYATVTFANTGGRAATSGNVTFGTHIIGLLGIDWATVWTTRPVPVPLAGGVTKDQTWEICVDAWRVPLGMHMETRDVFLS